MLDPPMPHYSFSVLHHLKRTLYNTLDHSVPYFLTKKESSVTAVLHMQCQTWHKCNFCSKSRSSIPNILLKKISNAKKNICMQRQRTTNIQSYVTMMEHLGALSLSTLEVSFQFKSDHCLPTSINYRYVPHMIIFC